MFDWLKTSLSHLWEGLLKNLGTAIAAFILSGGYLIAIHKLHEFQQSVRRIPTDYVLTPLVLLLVVAAALWNVNRRQREQLLEIQQKQPEIGDHGDQASRFVTHYGVWWKIYPEAEYIEDFPYCPCCEPRKKLVQTAWHPDEVFRCPGSGTEIKFYDGIPRGRRDVLRSLYRSYFEGSGVEQELMVEFHRLKELNPAMDETDLIRRVFACDPFNRIPKEEIDSVLARFTSPDEVFLFFHRHHRSYRRFLRHGASKGQ